jgi:hypothetical protein
VRPVVHILQGDMVRRLRVQPVAAVAAYEKAAPLRQKFGQSRDSFAILRASSEVSLLAPKL